MPTWTITVFSFKKIRGKEDANLGLRHNRYLFYLITQALFMFTPSHLAISQIDDVSNWKAWNILEQSIYRGAAILLLPSAGSQMEKIKKRFGACFGRATKELPLVWSRQFWLFHGFQSPTVFRSGPRGEK